MVKYFLIVFLFSGFYGNGQTLASVTKIETSYQTCLDKGKNKKGCAYKFYIQADSLLNATYKNLKLKLNRQEFEEFKKEQQMWLLKRDIYFKVAYDEVKAEKGIVEGTEDFTLLFTDKKSQFVLARVKALLNRL